VRASVVGLSLVGAGTTVTTELQWESVVVEKDCYSLQCYEYSAGFGLAGDRLKWNTLGGLDLKRRHHKRDSNR
jgi:capsule polysaccharide export protein KpsC/LpsZ